MKTQIKKLSNIGGKNKVKDAGQHPVSNNTVSTQERKHYSDKELNEFRLVILEKLEQAKSNYELLRATLCHTGNNGTDDTAPSIKIMEEGGSTETREEIALLAFRQEKFIRDLQNALIRIENKTYGICRITDKLIPRERLLSVPHATLSIDAKMER